MSDFDPKTGRFLPGHKINEGSSLPDDLKKRLKENKTKLVKMFNDYGNKTIEEILEMTKHETALTPMQKTVIKYWETLSEKSDPALLRIMFHLYGIPVDLKAIAIADNFREPEDPMDYDGGSPIKMTKAEKKRMLTIAMEAVESEGDEDEET